MAPIERLPLGRRFPVPSTATEAPTRSSLSTEGGFLEAWAEGYNVGSLVILILIVFCNYRSGILLHKLILLELVLALWHGTFIFAQDPVYGWYLSATATLLFVSYQIHNIVAWLKIRPFLPKWGSRFFILSLLAVQPFWVAEAWSNFEYFNSLGSDVNRRLRPWEALVRDPWWIFTTWKLVDSIRKTYGFKLLRLIRINSRFGVMVICMFISIAFLLTDVVVTALHLTADSGINPYWRFALVFKCASDTIFLDDFKSVLDDIIAKSFNSQNRTVHRGSVIAHKKSRSGPDFHDGPDFIECGPITNVTSPQQMIHKRSLIPFNSKPRGFHEFDFGDSMAEIHVEQEMKVTSEPRKPSQESYAESYASNRNILRAPKPAVTPRKYLHESETSLPSCGPSDSKG